MPHSRPLVTLFVLLASITPPAGAEPPPAPLNARVRPGDNRTATLLVRGLGRSATFRALIQQLDAGDVITYLRREPALRGRYAGRLSWVGASLQARYVRIDVNPELAGDLAVAALAHELQHAVEIAREPSIVDAESFAAFYRENGDGRFSGTQNTWDTEAARDAADEVRRQLAGARAGRAADEARTFNPSQWYAFYQAMRERFEAERRPRSITATSRSRRGAFA